MIKYKNNKNGKIAIVISDNAAGMDYKNLGYTFVIYKYEEDDYDFPLIMEHIAFYKEHSKE